MSLTLAQIIFFEVHLTIIKCSPKSDDTDCIILLNLILRCMFLIELIININLRYNISYLIIQACLYVLIDVFWQAACVNPTNVRRNDSSCNSSVHSSFRSTSGRPQGLGQNLKKLSCAEQMALESPIPSPDMSASKKSTSLENR